MLFLVHHLIFSTNLIDVTIFVTASDKYFNYDPVLLEFYIYFPLWVHTYITPENIFIWETYLSQIKYLFCVLVEIINKRGNIPLWVSIFLITSFWILLDSQVWNYLPMYIPTSTMISKVGYRKNPLPNMFRKFMLDFPLFYQYTLCIYSANTLSDIILSGIIKPYIQ